MVYIYIYLQGVSTADVPLALVTLGHSVLFICFRSEKIQNLMRAGETKPFGKTIIEPIFGKGNECDLIKKHWTHFWKS